MKKMLFVLLIASLLLVACGGKTPGFEDANEAAAQATIAAEEAALANSAQPTSGPAITLPTQKSEPEQSVATQVPAAPSEDPAVDLSEVFTASDPNICVEIDITQEDIDGEMLQTNGAIWQNVAIGAAGCGAIIEGRWFEGFKPNEIHHVTGFYGAGENVSLYQGSQWLLPVGATPREVMYNLAVGKCENWHDAEVEPEPIQFDYVDMEEGRIVHLDSSCEEVSGINPLPSEIGLIPAKSLPHYNLGYTWGGVNIENVEPAVSGAGNFTGVSRFDSENRGMTCGKDAVLGNDEAGVLAIDPSWDEQCIYLLDGMTSQTGIGGTNGVGLVRGEDIADASFNASVWSVPAGWVATKWADQFAGDRCPTEYPVLIYENGTWSTDHTYNCPE